MRFGGGCGGGRDGNNGIGGGKQGGHGSNTNPPTNTGRKLWVADRPVAKEVGRRRRNDGLGDGGKSASSAIGAHRVDGETSVRSAISAHRGWGKIREVRHRRPQNISEACHRGAHSEVSHRLPQDISEACHRGAHSEACHHGSHRILVWPAIAALTMFINDKYFVKDNIPCNMIHLDCED